MSVTGQWMRPGDDAHDRRTVAAISAALVGAALGIGQLWFGQTFGILAWRGGDSPARAVDESAIVIWLAAVAVSLGAAAPRLFLPFRPSRRHRLELVGMAVFGALLTAPVATAIAVWSQMYGGDLSQLRVMRLVVCGVALGALMGMVAVRSQASAWSLVCWLGAGWTLMLGSVHADPDISPMLGHLDPGPEWSLDSRMLQSRLVLLAVAAVIGAGLGAAATTFNWGAANLSAARRVGVVPTPYLAVACGPILMVAAYLVAATTDGQLRGVAIAGLVVAGLCAALGAYCGAKLARGSVVALALGRSASTRGLSKSRWTSTAT